MEAPYASVPALPAALGLVCGLATGCMMAGAAWLWAGAGVALLAGVGMWLWADMRFFAMAPLCFAAGMVLSLSVPDEAQPRTDDGTGEVRTRLTDAIYASPLDGDAAAFLATTLVADGRYMRRAVREDFRNSGMAHILALSGFHVGVVAMLLMWLTCPMLLVRRLRPWRPLPVLAAVWAFAWLGGMGASLLRAALMISLLLVARWSGRHYSSLNALAVAAIVILLLRPSAIGNVGFALSFAAVAGIMLLMPVLNPVDRRRHPRLHGAVGTLAVPVCATLATAPIVASAFGALPLLFVPANVALTLVFAPFYALAILVVALSSAGVAFAPLTACVHWLYRLISATAGACSSTIAVDFPAWAIALFYASLLALVLLGHEKSGIRN